MTKQWENWSLIILETLFALCAASVVVYKLLGIFDFGFFSYRFFNIVVSIAICAYIIQALLKSDQRVYLIITVFSLFHFTEGLIIHFWFKTVIHFMILLVMMWIYFGKSLWIRKKYRQTP